MKTDQNDDEDSSAGGVFGSNRKTGNNQGLLSPKRGILKPLSSFKLAEALDSSLEESKSSSASKKNKDLSITTGAKQDSAENSHSK